MTDRDGTEGRRAAQELQFVLDRAPVRLAHVDAECRILFVNRAYTEWFGRTPADVTGKQIAEVVGAAAFESFRCHVESAIAGQPVEFELPVPFAAGTRIMHCTYVPDPGPPPVGFVAVIADVTDRVRADEALAATHAELRESEERFRRLIEASAQMVWTTDATGTPREDSPSWRAFTGYRLDQWLDSWEWLTAFHPEDRERLAAVWQQALESRVGYEVEARIHHVSGEYRHVLCRALPLLNADGSVQVWVGMNVDLTEQKRADAALRESESFYRQTLESIPGMTFTNTPDGACDYASEQWVEFTGVAASRFLGTEWVEVVHPDDRDRAFLAWRTAVAERGVYDMEFRIHSRDGRYEWFKVRSRPIRDASGAVVRWLGTAVNVDDLKRAETALRASEQKVHRQLVELEALYSSAPLGLCVFDRDLRFRRINERLAEMDGMPAAAHIGKTVGEVVPDLTAQAEDVLRRVLATGQPVRFEFRGETPARPGVEHVWDEHWYPLREADGTTEGVGVIVHDVTEQRRADEALRDREQRLRLALDFAEMGSWDWTIATGEVVWSAKTRELFGVNADTAITFELFESRLHPDDLQANRRATAEALQTGSYDNEYRVILTGGQIRWMATRGRVLPDAHGQPARILGLVADVTARKQAEFALKEADRHKDEFVAMLAHELRNPLAPIRSGIQVLRLSSQENAVSSKVLAMMDRQLGHMVRLIDDLLDVSRISRGTVELKKKPITLRSAVESAVETSQPLIEAGRHELFVQLPDVPLWLDADPTRVAQVFSNLLNNAAKYTPPGGRITLTAARDNDSVVLRVTDTGVGIPRQLLSTVFGLFTQVGRTLDHAQGGLGIGLSLARQLVEMHGGTIQADSPGPGQGSTFIVRLPLATDPPPT